MNDLPKLTASQKVGIEAADYFSAKFAKSLKSTPIPQSIDLGIDFYSEILDGETPTGICFNIQCKGTSECETNERDYFSISIKIKSMNYWKLQRDPTFIILVDIENECFYWAYPFPKTSIYTSIENIKKDQKSDPTRTIKIPKDNKLLSPIKSLPIEIVQIIHEYHSSSLNHTSIILKNLHSKISQTGNIVNVLIDIEKIHRIIENALSSISIMEKEIVDLQNEVINIIMIGVVRLDMIIELIDTSHESKLYLKDRSILNEKFGKYTPNEIKQLISGTLITYKANPSLDNFHLVIDNTKNLSEYVKSLIYFYNELEMDEKLVDGTFIDSKKYFGL
jgi:hypothetical protein